MPTIKQTINYIFIALALILTIAIVIPREIDGYFDRRDTMLCNTARRSGNEEYLELCECFYSGEDIRCIYE